MKVCVFWNFVEILIYARYRMLEMSSFWVKTDIIESFFASLTISWRQTSSNLVNAYVLVDLIFRFFEKVSGSFSDTYTKTYVFGLSVICCYFLNYQTRGAVALRYFPFMWRIKNWSNKQQIIFTERPELNKNISVETSLNEFEWRDFSNFGSLFGIFGPSGLRCNERIQYWSIQVIYQKN